MSVKVVSFINLKGGVAKTTTTVGVSLALSAFFHKRVLVIDLDPQTNATAMLIGEKRWRSLYQNNYTIAALFEDAINVSSNFDVQKCLQKSVGAVKEVKTVDLIPSSVTLIDTQDRLITIPAGKFKIRNPVNILYNGVMGILDNYDYVLIDCPPNLGYITLNGLRISDMYVIPTIPDILSTLGIPQIVSRVAAFSKEIGHEIVPLGIVATKVRSQTQIHSMTMKTMHYYAGKPMGSSSGLFYPTVFNTFFPDSAQIAAAADFLEYNTIRQKWGSQGKHGFFEAFAKELIDTIEVTML